MTTIPVLGSTLGQIFSPIFEGLAWILAFFYALLPNYVFAIGMLTLTIMLATAPLTVKSTRSMFAMQKLQPEIKKLQQRYKGDRVTLNEEMMKLYREKHVSPAGGCLPMVLQFPIFICLYDVIRGLTNTVTHHGQLIAEPRYISQSTRIFHDLTLHPGQMKAFGLNLAANLFSPHSGAGYIPYALMVLVAIGLQFLQMRQMSSRNPAAAQANPQMQAMQKYMPIIFGVIYLRIAAGVNVYFIVSALCRIGIQEWVFRAGLLDRPPRRAVTDGGGRRSIMDRLAEAQQRALEQQKASQGGETGPRPPLTRGTGPGAGISGRPKPKPGPTGRPSGGRPPAEERGAGTNGSDATDGGGAKTGDSTGSARGRRPDVNTGGGRQPAPPAEGQPKSHPRSKAKKSRKAR